MINYTVMYLQWAKVDCLNWSNYVVLSEKLGHFIQSPRIQVVECHIPTKVT